MKMVLTLDCDISMECREKTNNNYQITNNFKIANPKPRLEFYNWNLFFICYLIFEI